MSQEQRAARPSTGSSTGGGKPVAAALAGEWTRLWTVPSTWWCLVTAAAVMLGLGLAFALEAAGDPGTATPPQPAWVAGEFAILTAQFVLMVMVTLAVTSEYATGAISTTLQWTPRRGLLLVARTVVPAGVATVAGVVLAVVTDVAARMAFSRLELPLADTAKSLGTIAIVLASGALLTVGAGLLLRSTAGALATVLLLWLVLPLVLPVLGVGWLQTAAAHLPGTAAMSLFDGLGVGNGSTSATTAIGILAVWTGAALTAGATSVIKRDAA